MSTPARPIRTAAIAWLIVYLVGSAGVLAIYGGSSQWAFVLLHAALVVLFALSLRAGGGALAALGDLGPLIVAPLLYLELGRVIGALYTSAGAVPYHDVLIQGWEFALFHTQPSQTLASALPNVVVSEVLHAGYLAYYLAIFLPPLWLYAVAVRRPVNGSPAILGESPVILSAAKDLSAIHRDPSVAPLPQDDSAVSYPLSPVSCSSDTNWQGFHTTVLAVVVTCTVCWALYVAFPVQGPRFLWAAPSGVPNGPFRELAMRILAKGSSRGAAFPSSHMAVMTVETIMAWRWHHRGVGWLMIVLSVLVGVGAVYGGFHYGIDMVTGAVLGAVVGAGILAWVRRQCDEDCGTRRRL